MILPLPRSEVFPFFAEAVHLESITPPELRFHIITPQPILIKAGTLIEDNVDYQLPFFPIGELAYPVVYFQLKRIFFYRQRAIRNTLLR